jgi:hypothetical protein
MIGTNNTGHQMQDPEEVAAGIERILELLAEKSPATKVLLLGIFPRGASPWDPARLNNIGINQRIRRLADGERVRYLDLSSAFLEPDGTLAQARSCRITCTSAPKATVGGPRPWNRRESCVKHRAE